MDVVGVPRLAPDAESRICAADELPYGWTVLDIGPRTASDFSEAIAGAGTIFWSGPMGLFEWPRFAGGTDTIARAVAESNAFSVVRGADTLHALDGLGLLDRVSWAAGGGAAFELPAAEELPGVAVTPPA
jgi:phosphoglycerate kinase